jgi:hypothetical protein
MAKSLNHDSKEVERIIIPFLDSISAANHKLSTPFLEIEDVGDDTFVVNFIVKYSEPLRRDDYEQTEEPC